MARAVAHSEASNRAAGTSVCAERKPRAENARPCAVRSAGALADVLPVDQIASPALAALGVLLPFRNHGARVAARAHEMGLAHHAPGVGPVVANLEITLRNPNLHVVHVEDDIVFGRILDHAIPGTAPQSLRFRAIAATAGPPDVSHACLAPGPEWRPAG